MLNLLCKVGRHHGTWVYDSKQREKCTQTRICLRCGDQGDGVRHDVRHWRSNGLFEGTESGVCIRCRQSITRVNS